jgi:hypothetical protein
LFEERKIAQRSTRANGLDERAEIASRRVRARKVAAAKFSGFSSTSVMTRSVARSSRKTDPSGFSAASRG